MNIVSFAGFASPKCHTSLPTRLQSADQFVPHKFATATHGVSSTGWASCVALTTRQAIEPPGSSTITCTEVLLDGFT